MTTISASYTRKVEIYSQTKFVYWRRSNLLKSPLIKKKPFAKSWKVWLNIKLLNIKNIIILNTKSIKTSQKHFENLFLHNNFDWSFIYFLPRLLTEDSRLRAFQYKMVKNTLYLNKKLFQLWKGYTSLYSFCRNVEETSMHLFSDYNYAISNWIKLRECFKDYTS